MATDLLRGGYDVPGIYLQIQGCPQSGNQTVGNGARQVEIEYWQDL